MHPTQMMWNDLRQDATDLQNRFFAMLEKGPVDEADLNISLAIEFIRKRLSDIALVQEACVAAHAKVLSASEYAD